MASKVNEGPRPTTPEQLHRAEELIRQLVQRQRAGEQPDPDQLILDNPSLAAVLEEQLCSLRAAWSIQTGPHLSSSGAPFGFGSPPPPGGGRYEIIDGERYVTPSPNLRHQLISSNLLGAIWGFLQEHRLGTVLSAPSDVVLGESDIVQPDVLFVSRERASILAATGTQGAPDLVVEILSESTRRTDEKIKRALYERTGVREYWIVDPALDTIKVYRCEDAGFAVAAELDLERGDSLRTPLLPGFELPLAKIFPAG